MRKALYLLVAFVASLSALTAQQAGQTWLGGSALLYTEKKVDGLRTKNYGLTPEVGYNLTDNFGVGIRLGYVHREDFVQQVIEKTDGYTIHPFIRYSFLHGILGNLFVDANGGYEYRKSGLSDSKVHLFEAGLRPGVMLCLSPRIAFTGRFGFIGGQYEKRGDEKTVSMGLDMDMSQMLLGVSILFW